MIPTVLTVFTSTVAGEVNKSPWTYVITAIHLSAEREQMFVCYRTSTVNGSEQIGVRIVRTILSCRTRKHPEDAQMVNHSIMPKVVKVLFGVPGQLGAIPI